VAVRGLELVKDVKNWDRCRERRHGGGIKLEDVLDQAQHDRLSRNSRSASQP
jgi:hypothetical protein